MAEKRADWPNKPQQAEGKEGSPIDIVPGQS